jgi:hypothetical protein
MYRRVLIVAGGLVAAWLVALVVIGAVLSARQARGTAARLGESLQGSATIGASDLALVRGRLELEHLSVHRDDALGHLALDVGDVRCELAPLGWALVDPTCRELYVGGTHLEVSAAALLQIKNPHHAPIRAQRVVIDDATFAFAPSAFVPDLGRIAIAIDHAEAGPTVLRTPLSWIFALERLRARLELPAGIALTLGYDRGLLSVAGSVFGSSPVALPVALPIAAGAHDAREELDLLVATGEDLAARLVEKRAEDWLRAKLR